MSHSTRIASLHLLENRNVEFIFGQHGTDDLSIDVARLCAVVLLWGNPDFQAMLDKAVEADTGGVPFE